MFSKIEKKSLEILIPRFFSRFAARVYRNLSHTYAITCAGAQQHIGTYFSQTHAGTV